MDTGFILSGIICEIIGAQYENIPIDDERLTKAIIPNKRYTDDTEMTLSLITYLLHHKKIDMQKLHKYYAKYYTPGRGYSKSTRKILERIKAGDMFFPPRTNDTNGCLMRASPLVLYCKDMSKKEIVDVVTDTIYMTHLHDDSVFVVYLYIKIMHFFLREGLVGIDVLYKFIRDECEYRSSLFPSFTLLKMLIENNNTTPKEFNNLMWGKEYVFHIKAIECLCTALFIFYKNINGPLEAMDMCIEFGGDVDTVAKILGEFLGAVYGIEWIPDTWKDIEIYDTICKMIEIFNKKYN